MYNSLSLDSKLYALLGSLELVERWWNSPNKAFDYDTPEQVWRSSPQKVEQYINRFISGDYS